MSTRKDNKLNLYRRRWFQATLAVLLACSAVLSAYAFQRRTPHRLRATAVVELTTDANGKVTPRLVPVAILADGRFHDATIYETRPRPLALGDGVVYEAQKSGVPLGYVTINGASRTLEGWAAQGQWQAVGQVRAKATPRASTQPSAPADDRPVLHRGSGDNSQQQQQPPPPSDQSQSQPQSQSSDDRPVLHRSGEQTPPQSSPSNPPASSPPPSSEPAPQTDSSPDPDDPNRPVLRRRKPPATNETETTPAAGKPNVPATAPQTQPVPSRPVQPATPGTQTLVAVSDAQSSDSRSYIYNWKAGEEEKIAAKMRKLALAQLPGENAQTNEHAMTNVVVRSFDLDLSNDAVVVITAEVPGGYLASGAKSAPGKFVSRYITVIARVDIDGNPQKLAASVTDSSRLDVAPRLELVDAVDVDGDGLAELLFREYDFDQKSFIIYGVGHGTVTKVFEGASGPIK